MVSDANAARDRAAAPGGGGSRLGGDRPHADSNVLAARPTALHEASPGGYRRHHAHHPRVVRHHRAVRHRRRLDEDASVPRRRASGAVQRGRRVHPLAILGYNEQGQNLFARLAKATQTSLIIGLAAVVIIVVIGVLVGSIAGYVGGWLDNLLMRFVDIMLSLPALFVILMITAFFGQGNAMVVILAIGLTGWTTAARLVRAEFLSLREVDYVQAARALGASPRRIILAPHAAAGDGSHRGRGDARHRRLGGRRIRPQLPRVRIGRDSASLGTMLQNARDYFFPGRSRSCTRASS